MHLSVHPRDTDPHTGVLLVRFAALAMERDMERVVVYDGTDAV